MCRVLPDPLTEEQAGTAEGAGPTRFDACDARCRACAGLPPLPEAPPSDAASACPGRGAGA